MGCKLVFLCLLCFVISFCMQSQDLVKKLQDRTAPVLGLGGKKVGDLLLGIPSFSPLGSMPETVSVVQWQVFFLFW